jgi:hypothetical protein
MLPCRQLFELPRKIEWDITPFLLSKVDSINKKDNLELLLQPTFESRLPEPLNFR